MSKNTNRKGLALGAMFSLVASLFGALPASANVSTTAFVIAPAGADTSTFGTLIDDDFTLLVTRNVDALSATDFTSNQLKFALTTNRSWGSTHSLTVRVEKADGTTAVSMNAGAANVGQSIWITNDGATATEQVGVSTTISGTASAAVGGSGVGSPWPSTYSFVVNPSGISGFNSSNTQTKVTIRLSGADFGTFSPSVVVTVRPFLDQNNNNIWDTSEPSATQAVTFNRYSAVTPSLTVAAVDVGATSASATATFTGLNLDQIPGKFAIRFTQWGAADRIGSVSYSPLAEQVINRAKGSSISDTVTIISASASNTISAQVVYMSGSAVVFSSAVPAVEQLGSHTYWPLVTRVIDSATIAGQSGTDQLYAVRGSNANPTGHFRPNSLITVRYSVSQTVASSEVPVTFTFNNPTLSTEKTISIDGGTAVTSLTASALVKNTNTSGVASFTILTAGFVAGDVITVSAKVSGLAIRTITLTAQSPTYTITPDSTTVATTPGGSAALSYVVTDQYRERVSGSSFRLKLVWTAGYNGTATTSFTSALANGVASAALTHAPATFTGSGTVRATLQTFSTANNLWSDGTATADTTVIVTNNTNSFRQGLLATYSASISYGADFTWSATINRAFVLITGSSVVATGTGLIFRDMVESKTASDTIRLQSNGDGNVQFQVTARKAGTYPVTLTAGTATTTTLITIHDAAESAGSNIAFDLSSMTSGRAAIITGTLTDVNGNPVDTTAGSGGANIQLTVTGTGAAFVGSLTSETNAAGKFSVALLSGAGDVGTVTITAVYFPTSGAAAADRVTKVHSVSVVAAAAPEVNAVIGSFNGRWAVRVENAKGSVVSVKAGNRWVKFSALNNNYLYSMKSVKGRTIAVSVWVDGELQNSQTITIN